MIVDGITIEDAGADRLRRSAVLRWASHELELAVTAPAELVEPSDDASAHLCVALPIAMRHGEDLVVTGPISPALLRRLETIQSIYAAWDPTMHPVTVHAVPAADQPRPRAAGRAAYLSRGVDSVFTAARDRAGARELSALVMVDGLEPRHDAAVRGEERRRAGVLADRLDLPLVSAESTVRDVTDVAGFDWEDALGAGLSFVAHNLAAGFGTVRIPSSDSYESVEPCGSSPLLDPLFSTERCTIEHDTLTHTRLRKVQWLAERSPALLEHVKVCYAQNRPDNCGGCGKCLYTMACLRVAGATHLAPEFPAELDLDAVRAMRLPHLKARIDWAELVTVVEPGQDDALRSAILATLEACVLTGPDRETPLGPTWASTQWVRNHRLNQTLSLVIEGRPYPPAPSSTT